MHKLRDFDSKLQALTDKAKLLQMRKLHQLGQLVVATGADALSIEHLAGLLLAGVESKDASAEESWRTRGAAFFQRKSRAGRSDQRDNGVAAADNRGTSPA
ncbi:conjugal transfer protein TraD [Sphingomonas sp. GB1N7]